MGLGESIISTLRRRQERRRLAQRGAIGDFWRAGGNGLLTADLPIDAEGTVIDGGAYTGEWLRNVAMEYGCHVDAYEAVPEYATRLASQFARNPRVTIHSCALGASATSAQVALARDGSTLMTERFRGMPQTVSIQTRDAEVEVRRIAAERPIGCVKLNVEGSEYEILERLIEGDSLPLSASWLIQFHRVDERSRERREAIRTALGRTHTCRWCFDFIWELWVRTTPC